MSGPVIVGVDGSKSALTAVDLAAEAAVRRGLDLELVHVYQDPLFFPSLVPDEGLPVPPAVAARALLADAAAAVGTEHPGLVVRTTLVKGHPGGELVVASRRASFLFVGHRGLGGFTGLLLGSVSAGAITHALCPVVVARAEPPRPDAPIVVGVDGSPGSRAAVRMAFAEAQLRGVALTAAVVWPPARVWASAVQEAGFPAGEEAYDPIEVSLAGIRDRFPDVPLTTEICHGTAPPQTLAAVAARTGAGLVVVGYRGGGGFRGLLLGGTSRALVDHAPCPVMVVRHPAEAPRQ